MSDRQTGIPTVLRGMFKNIPNNQTDDSKQWEALLEELEDLQNTEHHLHHDIMTITGFMSTLEELEAHVKRNRR